MWEWHWGEAGRWRSLHGGQIASEGGRGIMNSTRQCTPMYLYLYLYLCLYLIAREGWGWWVASVPLFHTCSFLSPVSPLEFRGHWFPQILVPPRTLTLKLISSTYWEIHFRDEIAKTIMSVVIIGTLLFPRSSPVSSYRCFFLHPLDASSQFSNKEAKKARKERKCLLETMEWKLGQWAGKRPKTRPHLWPLHKVPSS